MTSWSDLPNFTTVFGSTLHGAEITWYNNPSASGAKLADKTNLHIKFTQNLQSLLYTWYDPDNVSDAKWFKGNFALKAAVGTTIAGANANEWINTPIAVDADPAVALAAPLVGVQDIIFALQFDNPISTRTPTKDGVRTGVTPTLKFTPGAAEGSVVAPTASWATIPLSTFDLVPAADYAWTTYDFTVAANGCDNTTVGSEYVHATRNNEAGEWLVATDPGVTLGPSGLCDESWTIGQSGYACVKLTQRLTRPMTPTKETKCDFAIDYVVHTVKIKIGVEGGATD